MKKVFAVLLATAMISSLAGCAASTKPAASSAAGSSAASAPGSSAASAAPSQAAPLDFPTKPITLVNPYEAGGTSDIPSRIFAKYMSKNMPKPINVNCIAGSGGALGAQEVMKANPDGYTLLVAPAGYAMQYAKGTTDFTYEDFEPVCMFVTSYLALAVNAESPYQTYEDLVEAAKSAPGKLKFGVATGGLPVFATLAMEKQENIDFNIVDIGGNTLKAPELLSGRVDVIIDSLAACVPYMESGDFRVLGLYADNRFPAYQDIPTFKELGYDTSVMNQVFGVWAPKGTPAEVIEYMAKEFEKAATDPELMKELTDLNYTATYIAPAPYKEMLKSMYADFVEFAKLLT